ncbi:TonB-dependent receptor [Flavihumibacter sp. R14]|nr:TonB-dependent receptor [Flavihumibacter soli]
MIRIVFFFLIFCFTSRLFAQQPTQTIRGKVSDVSSGHPLAYVTLSLENTSRATATDNNGNFIIQNVAIGRYSIQVSLVGYEPLVLREILLTSGKEVFVNISMKEMATSLDEVVVRPKIDKQQALNPMATVSAKMLSVEEAKRYAGGFDDPARLVSAFAGVTSSGVGSNAIVVRGNSPQSLQWKLEGVEIPNPNHFADLAAFGGGGLTALSAQLLANSDFLSGAMPAEYSNALSGVFDIFMRSGNSQKREHTLQVGAIGVDIASEGPFKRGRHSSYLFNYRYSTLGLLEPFLGENAGGTNYQDLSFKMNFPTQKRGTFSVWGIGLIDRSGATAKENIDNWQYYEDRENSDVKQYMGAGGINYGVSLNKKQFLRTTLAATINSIDMDTERVDGNLVASQENVINNKTYNLTFSTYLNTKFNASHTNKTGVVVTSLNYQLLLRNAGGASLRTIVDENDNSNLVNVYSSSSLQVSEKMIANFGLNAQFFTFNNSYSIEPRAGLKYNFNPNQSLSLAYGLHSRLERLNYYFIKDASDRIINNDLSFTKAHHLILGYDFSPWELSYLKIEAYYQNLFDVPVIANTSFSMINQQNDWFLDEHLENKGKGRNYGVDFTFEKYLSQGYYFMSTASLFSSKYKGDDNQWRNTRYNRNFALNFLAGKEWQVGKNKSKVVGLNTRLSFQGGDRYSPVNLAESIAEKEPVFVENSAFSQQLSPAFTNHFTATYKINKRKSTQEISLKLINTTMYKEFQGFRYNFTKHSVDEKREAVFIPNLSYKIEF